MDAAIIHPRWVIDENAIIDRRRVWFMPKHPPVKALNPATIMIRWLSFEVKLSVINNIQSGASFCHVTRIRQFIHDRAGIICVNQVWAGARPTLIIIEVDNNIIIRSWLFMDNKPTPERRRIIEPIDWARKYVIEASVSMLDLFLDIIGTNLNKFTSNLIHAKIQFDLEIHIRELRNNKGLVNDSRGV